MRRLSGRRRVVIPAALAASGAVALLAAGSAGSHPGGADPALGTTATPIKHVVVIIGENHTFDNVFATYRAPAGQSVENLLSEGIVTANGAPGPDVAKARQDTASDTRLYRLSPKRTGAYASLPQPNTTSVSPECDGQPMNVPDARFPAALPNAPYQITKYVPYFDNHREYRNGDKCQYIGAYVGDPLHRFYQMYQQVSRGANDLWTWVHVTAGDSNGQPPPTPFTDESTHQGAVDMGFYNVAEGDVPVLTYLAQHYAMSDNYHQSVMGGTGSNHIALGTGYAAYYQDAQGRPVRPPTGEIENPNPGRAPTTGTRRTATAGAGRPTEAATPTAPTTAPPA